MEKEKFEQLINEGIIAIPEKFLRLLNNVAIVVEEEPTPEQKKKLHIHDGVTLFGLYEGIPQTVRGSGYSGVLPDKITIFLKPIVEAAQSEEEIKEAVRNTVWHEIAHHFGFDEKRVRVAERKRTHPNKLENVRMLLGKKIKKI